MTSAATPSSKNHRLYSQKKKYWAGKVAELVNGGFKPDPTDPRRCVFCHRRHGPTALLATSCLYVIRLPTRPWIILRILCMVLSLQCSAAP